MPRYHCTSCGQPFERGGEKLRCPNCLRQHGLEPIDDEVKKTPAPGKTRRLLLTGLLGLFVVGLLGGAGLLIFKHRTELPAPGQLALLDADTLRRALKRRGVPEKDIALPYGANAQMKQLTANTATLPPRERARELARRMVKMLEGVRVDLAGAAKAPVRTAAELHVDLSAKKATGVLSFELAIWAVAILRASGLTAMVCQAHRLTTPMATADSSGGIGRYLAAVYEPNQLGKGPVLVLDPARATNLPAWAGGAKEPKLTSQAVKLHPIDDLSAVGHLLGLRALRLRRSKPGEAYRLSDLAFKAAAPSSTLHMLRTRVLVAAGGLKDAAGTAQKALSVRDDPSTRTTLAQVLAADGAVHKSINHLEQALKQDPQYWPAHQTLAAALMLGDQKRALKHLEAGLKVAPDASSLLLIKASYLMGQDRPAQAVTLLRQIISRGNDDPDVLRLLLYQALRRSGQADKARKTRGVLLEKSKDRKKMEKILQAVDEAMAPNDPRGAPPGLPPKPTLKLPDVSLGK